MVDLRKIRKRKEDTRVRKIEITLTEKEKETIFAMAEKEHLKLSTYIRWRLLRES